MIDVREFIYNNYTEYKGNGDFLCGISDRNKKLWDKCLGLLEQERNAGGVLDIETNKFSGINNFGPGYIDKDLELIVGFQSDAPLKRLMNPYGGMRMVKQSLDAYGYQMNEELEKSFNEFRKTHNDGVFDVYPKNVRLARHTGLLTGLPDSYGRGRIVGDYRRVALYGIDKLIEDKQKDLDDELCINNEYIQLREEIAEQIKALKEMKKMALSYGIDISKPAQTAQEAIQAIYFAYLAGAKENNGAATSLGRTSTFIDIYIEKDIAEGRLTEEEAQELIDQFIMKLRFIRHLRTPAYDELFGGDPTWITESIGGMNLDGRSWVTKTSYRFLQSLRNLGSAPEPNLTILWDKNLPENFKQFCSQISIETDAIQYENDELMRQIYGDDYVIACCVSAMEAGKQMQYFGARCNLAKCVLYAINGGVDELTGELVVPNIEPITDEYLSYNTVWENLRAVLRWTVNTYVQANNIIHYMHDKYAYEASQMALLNSNPKRLMAFGLSGFSVATDSLSAIQYGKVKPIRNEKGIAISFEISNDFPKYGNDNDTVDVLGILLTRMFYKELEKYSLYRNAKPTVSILTITSNVVYGKKTGATPDGRASGAPFAPGANPMHGRDLDGALASLNSVAKMPYQHYCRDGISNTFSMVPQSLGKSFEE
jgi:formate C-acetyltransferase